MSRMSYGKLNIWFRGLDCGLLKTCWMTDLVIKTCDGKYLVDMDPNVIEFLKKRYPDINVSVRDYQSYRRINLDPVDQRKFNHIEVDAPPGCYVIWTRVCYQSGKNEETNKVMAIVDCGEEVCVNLLLNSVETCAKEILYPFAIQAINMKLEREVGMAIELLMKVGGVTKEEFTRDLNLALKELKTPGGKKEAKEFLQSTEKLLGMMESLDFREVR
jgi:hypothetical protein